ncbi:MULTISPECIES: NHLP leader peptide family RiPP precursor [unclassified Chryseobacterium]|uniref:NHLP leader peptide family RiPP precursor n=1 Tax=unclassified Chryseobacterium TaxID=2593645 RepID=UPI0021E5C42F|nr:MULTISPECIES: NHLP leader peptide family RiPP precursor [unclassified Chryseobacterium]MEA1847470.1 NHLP leader peptide family RiPP precursor [Chryseobacterium sp. MHB01]
MEITQEQKMYAEIVQKAWDDAGFKKELLENPVEAIEKLTGTKLNLPDGKRIIVRDQTDNSSVYINIPAKPNTDDIELNENQLDMVAGGRETGIIKDVVDFLSSLSLYSPK